MSSSINLGKQQITIYPYQEVTSANANQILYKILQPGVSNTRIELYAPTSPDQIGIKIFAGSTFVFEQSLIDAGLTRKFLIKCVLEDDVYLENISKSLYWGSTFATSEQLYLYADLNYDLSNAEAKYASFSLSDNKEIIDNDKNLILATLLNHQYYVKAYDNGSGTLSPSLSYYYISYEDQPNSDIFPMIYRDYTRFTPKFKGDLQSIDIEGSTILSGNSIVKIPTTEVTLPAKVTSYPVGSTEDDFYQVDVLRAKISKDPSRTIAFTWESTLLAKPTPPEDWVWTTAYSWTEDKIINYLNGKALDLKDSGHVILFMIRPSNAIVITDLVNNYPAWAEAGFNKIHPSICYVPKMDVLRIDEQDFHSRLKVPMYETSELV